MTYYLKIVTAALLVVMSVAKNLISYGQSPVALKGIVVSADDNQPLESASIQYLGTDIGTITNSEGKFTLIAPNGTASSTDSISFSCIGYADKVLSVRTLLSGNNTEIKLERSSTFLDEVVVSSISLQQLLDSINKVNRAILVSPAMLTGYYREFVFSNEKCTQYADALYNYYFNKNSKDEGKLNIAASRCLEVPKPEEIDRHNFEMSLSSKVDPNKIFDYAFWSLMQARFFPPAAIRGYVYSMQTDDEGNVLIQIDPNREVTEEGKTESGIYSLTINLYPDFTLRSYYLTIQESSIKRLKVRKMMGLSAQTLAFGFKVQYAKGSLGNYPRYFSYRVTKKLSGKSLGFTVNQDIEQRSEVLITSIGKAGNTAQFETGGVYKKGNICKNGKNINDAMLKGYTVITPSAKEKAIIDAMEPK